MKEMFGKKSNPENDKVKLMNIQPELKQQLHNKINEIRGTIQQKINESPNKNRLSKINNNRIKEIIDKYINNTNISNKSYNKFIDYLSSQIINQMETVN